MQNLRPSTVPYILHNEYKLFQHQLLTLCPGLVWEMFTDIKKKIISKTLQQTNKQTNTTSTSQLYLKRCYEKSSAIPNTCTGQFQELSALVTVIKHFYSGTHSINLYIYIYIYLCLRYVC